MKGQFTKSQVDRLGDRLRSGQYKESDLVFLDDYRKSFHEIYNTTVKTIRDRANLEPTGRPAKSTTAIIEKLKRESIRLSQIQDIAGCRIVVESIINQNQIVSKLFEIFPDRDLIDRRLYPSYGYRAVHVIVHMNGLSIEVQIRSMLQHLWAELSEKWADVIDPSIKYGGGAKYIQGELQEIALFQAENENLEIKIVELEKNEVDHKDKKELEDLRESVGQMRREWIERFRKFIEII